MTPVDAAPFTSGDRVRVVSQRPAAGDDFGRFGEVMGSFDPCSDGRAWIVRLFADKRQPTYVQEFAADELELVVAMVEPIEAAVAVPTALEGPANRAKGAA